MGNKCDLKSERKVEFATAEKFASEVGLSLFEVSAKTGINVEESFMELASAMRERIMLSRMDHYYDSSDSEEISSGFHVDGVIGKKQDYSCCFSSAKNGTFV